MKREFKKLCVYVGPGNISSSQDDCGQPGRRIKAGSQIRPWALLHGLQDAHVVREWMTTELRKKQRQPASHLARELPSLWQMGHP